MSLNTSTAFVKRRFSDDDEDEISRQEWPTYKRFNDNVVSSIQPSRLEKEQQEENTSMPAITYASPDYRPPVNPNALWLQPPPQQQPSKSSGLTMMVDETDSTDEDDLPTLVQTPSSSILLDQRFKGSSFEQNHWRHSFNVSATPSWHHQHNI